MPPQSLKAKLEATQSAANPFDALYTIAVSLRDVGLSQVDIYRIFADFYNQHPDDDPFDDAITDVLDCICGGGWAKSAPQLFDTSLINEQIGIVSVDVDESTANSGKWEMTIDHPHIYLRIDIHDPQIVHEFLAFLRRNLNHTTYSELKLGTLGSAAVSIIKDDEFPNRFFLCVLSDNGALRYTLNVNELGDYIGGLIRALDDLPNSN